MPKTAPLGLAEPMLPLPIAEPQAVGLSPAGLARLTGRLRSDIARGYLPGAVALIARRGRIAYFESLGALDPGKGTPMPADAIFRIYSMTKPIVSVAVMMLVEDGLVLVNDPLPKFLPEFAGMKVAVEQGGKVELVPAVRDITIQDLLRHTSGLAYEFRGTGPVQQMYLEAKTARREQSNADQAATLARLPLMHQPGTRWEYSRSTDVLGRLVEVISGRSLGEFLTERILAPLGMADTGFAATGERAGRVAEPQTDPATGNRPPMRNVTRENAWHSGGGGAVSTAADYLRFCQMLLNGGELDGVRLLAPKTVAHMAADHLPPDVQYGLTTRPRFGALAPVPGSVGEFFWGGVTGTYFWIDPQEDMVVVLMLQAPDQRLHYRYLTRQLVYAALTGPARRD